MALQETLEKSAHFVFFKSTDINLEPDLSGLLFDDVEIGREAFVELLNRTERGFIRASFHILGLSMRLIISNIKNEHIVTLNNLKISMEHLTDLKEADALKHLSMAFALFNTYLVLEPIGPQDMVLFIKSWEIIEY